MQIDGISRSRGLAFLVAALCAAAPAWSADVSARADNQKFNLYEPDPAVRFPLQEISWPKQVGEAEVCLWKDDKLAAISLTVDDNSAGDIDWWKEQAAIHGFPVTWFIITGRVGSGGNWGTWEQFAALDRDPGGHAVESHTVLHLHPELPEWQSIDWEYAESKAQIEKYLPGKTASALAYPGGPNTKLNDPAKAAKIYRSARAARGKPNSANQIDYFGIAAMSSINVGDEKGPWSDVNNIVDRTRYRGLFYRGWAVFLQHGVPAVQKEKLARLFAFIDEHKPKLWLGLFTDVAKYGQERDTATLKVIDVTEERIRLELTDLMDDTYFTHPLTVKVRLPDAWTTVVATQAGKAAKATLVTHEGAPYALVDAVPDAGVVALTAK